MPRMCPAADKPVPATELGTTRTSLLARKTTAQSDDQLRTIGYHRRPGLRMWVWRQNGLKNLEHVYLDKKCSAWSRGKETAYGEPNRGWGSGAQRPDGCPGAPRSRKSDHYAVAGPRGGQIGVQFTVSGVLARLAVVRGIR